VIDESFEAFRNKIRRNKILGFGREGDCRTAMSSICGGAETRSSIICDELNASSSYSPFLS